MTLVELLLVAALVAVLASIAVPAGWGYMERAHRAKAIADVQSLQTRLIQYRAENDRYPDSLSDVSSGERDPWGNLYEYLKLEGAPPSVIAHARKDRFLVPLNSTFDLYSMGPDGDSRAPLNAAKSRDDILRAIDGQFVGLAADF